MCRGKGGWGGRGGSGAKACVLAGIVSATRTLIVEAYRTHSVIATRALMMSEALQTMAHACKACTYDL